MSLAWQQGPIAVEHAPDVAVGQPATVAGCEHRATAVWRSRCQQRPGQPRRQWQVTPAGVRLELAQVAAVVLAADVQPWRRAELDVRPLEPERLADPQPGLGQQLEQQPPALGRRGQHAVKLGARHRLGLDVVLALAPATVHADAQGLAGTSPSSGAVAPPGRLG
jgi:hypothetical protein